MDGDVGNQYSKDWKGPKSHVFYVFDNPDSVRQWLLEKTMFDEIELNSIKLYQPGSEHLKLLLENGEDPTIVGFVWAMNPKQLDYFRRFEPTDFGHRELMNFGARWIRQAEQFDRVRTDTDFLKYHRDEAIWDSARARAYWVLANRHREEEFWTAGKDSRSPEFAKFYEELERAA